MPINKKVTTVVTTKKNKKVPASANKGKRQNKLKQVPKPSTKPKAKPKTVAQQKKKQQKKKTYKANRKTRVMNQALNRVKDGCIGAVSNVIELLSDNFYLALLDVIDKLLAVGQIQKPQMFTRQQNVNDPTTAGITAPTVPFVQARALWFCASIEYLMNLEVISDVTLSNIQKIQAVKLPIPLAKWLQQVAPFVDTSTGAEYRFKIPSLNTDLISVFVGCPDVSLFQAGVEPDPLTSFNSPISTYLIHPSQYIDGSFTTLDYNIANDRKNPSYPQTSTATASLTQFVAGLTPVVREAVNRIFGNGIEVDSIGRFAPDASFYCAIGDGYISCPSVMFDPVMAVVGPSNGTAPADSGISYPYARGFPFFGLARFGTRPTSFTLLQRYYRQIYCTLMSRCTKFCDTCTAIGNLKYSECFGMIKSFEVIGGQVNKPLIAERISSYMSLLANNSDTTTLQPNKFFGLSILIWQAINRRIADYDQMFDLDNNYAGFAMGLYSTDIRLPQTLATLVSGVGPVVIDGKLYVQYWESPMIQWDISISPSGVWNMYPLSGANSTLYGQCFYGPINGTNMIINMDDGSPYLPPATVKSVHGPVLTETYWNETMTHLYAETWALAVKPTHTCLGVADRVFGILTTQFASGDFKQTNSISTLYGRKIRTQFRTIYTQNCQTHVDSADCVVAGIMSTANLNNTDSNISAQAIALKVPPNDILPNLQAQASMSAGGAGSAVSYSALVQANADGNDIRRMNVKGLSIKDSNVENKDYQNSQRTYINRIDQISNDVFSKAEEKHSITDTFKSYTDFFYEDENDGGARHGDNTERWLRRVNILAQGLSGVATAAGYDNVGGGISYAGELINTVFN